MSQTSTPPADGDQVKQLTAEAAAKRVKRPVVTREPAGKDKDGNAVFKETTKLVPVSAAEVLSFKDYGTHVVVVTVDGKKFGSADAA